MFKECTALRVKYLFLISIVAIFFLAELIVGILSNSIALQTDAFHMLSDLLALIIGYASLLVLKRQRNDRYTYGWTRAEIIAGLINSVFLLSICFVLVLENIEKVIELISDTENDQLEEHIDLVLIVAASGLVVNFIGIALFYNEHSHTHQHAEVKNYAQYAVLLHIIGDTLGSVLVIASGLTIKYVEDSWKFFLDPLGSTMIVIFISISSSKLLWHCVRILMHRWSGPAAGDIQTELGNVDGVATVHDFHVWSLDNQVAIASMHVKMEPQIELDAIDQVLLAVKKVLHQRGIHCSTIQPEWAEQCIEPDCENDCGDKKCCQ